MKAVIIQPAYPEKGGERRCFDWIIAQLDAIVDADIILLPEGSNVPAVDPCDEPAFGAATAPTLIEAARRAAVRNNAHVAVNGCLFASEGDPRNRTILFGPDGKERGVYDKTHLTPYELPYLGQYSDYPPHGLQGIIDADGLRFGFVTCYDSYFDEYLETIAVRRPDIACISSYQRYEDPEILKMQAAHLAHKANCWVLRASWYMPSGLGGTSVVAGPDGHIKALLSEPGVLRFEFDPAQKRTAPKNQGMLYQADRHPQLYLPSGAFICRGQNSMPYPRVCAHRGFNSVAPENTLPALGLAIACGAQEVEFDLRSTKDGVPVVMHDRYLDRTTTGSGLLADHTLAEVKQLDAGSWFSPRFAGTAVPTFEDVLAKFACQAIFNVHVNPQPGDDDAYFQRIFDLIYKYGAENHVYIAGDERTMDAAVRLAPELARAKLMEWVDGVPSKETMLRMALQYKAQTIQLFLPYYDQAFIDEVRSHGIRVNFFFSDDPGEAVQLLDMGVDTILTNDYLTISNAVATWNSPQSV